MILIRLEVVCGFNDDDDKRLMSFKFEGRAVALQCIQAAATTNDHLYAMLSSSSRPLMHSFSFNSRIDVDIIRARSRSMHNMESCG